MSDTRSAKLQTMQDIYTNWTQCLQTPSTDDHFGNYKLQNISNSPCTIYRVAIKNLFSKIQNNFLHQSRQCLWCCHHGRAIARVHPVHLMNAELHQAAAECADPQIKPNNLVCESACRLPESTPTIAIYYYYSARKLILILPSCYSVGSLVITNKQ